MAIPSDFTTKTTKGRQDVIWYIEIEGLRVRYGSAVPSWSPADSGTNRPVKAYISEVPEIDGQEIKPLNGSCRPHGFTIRLADISDAITELISIHDTTGRSSTVLDSELAKTTTTMTVDDSSVFSFPCDLYVDRETVRATAAPSSTTITISRGMYGSTDDLHEIADAQGNDRSVIVSDKPRHIHTREVRLCETRTGLDEADAVSIRGVLDSIEESKPGEWRLKCEGSLWRLKAKIGLDAPRTTLGYPLRGLRLAYASEEDKLLAAGLKRNRIIGGHTIATSWCMSVSDASQFATTGFVAVENEIVEYEATDTASAIHKLIIDDEFSSCNMFRYIEPGYARGKFYWEMNSGVSLDAFFSDYDLPDMRGVLLNKAIRWHAGGVEIKKLLTHNNFDAGTDPVSIVLQILLSDEGDLSNHATYDTLSNGWGLGMPSSIVDVTGMESLRDSLPSLGWSMKFMIHEPVVAKKWIEDNVLRPAHLFFRELWDGTISLGKLYSYEEAKDEGAQKAIDESDLVAIPKFELSELPMSSLKIKCNHCLGKYNGIIEVIFGDSRDVYCGEARNYEIECATVYDPAIGITGATFSNYDYGTAPEFISYYLAPLYDRFAFNPPPVIEIEVSYRELTNVQAGDIITLTSTATPDLAGSSRGLSAMYCQVIKTKPKPRTGILGLTLWQIGIHDNPYRKIAPSGKISAWSSPTITLYDDELVVSGNPAQHFNSGDKVRLLNARHEELTPGETMVIDSVGSNTLTLTGMPTAAPSDGDYVETTIYDDSTASQQIEWCYGSDKDKLLGAGDDDGHERM